MNQKTEINDDPEIRSKLGSARKLIKRKRFKDANKLLMEICQQDKDNKEAQELVDKLEKGRRAINFRIMVIAIFLISVTVIAVLGWTELHSTEISLQLTVNQFTFTLDEDWEIYSVEAKTIGLSHLDDLELFPDIVEIAVSYEIETGQPLEWKTGVVESGFPVIRTTEYWNLSLQSDYLNLSSLSVDSGATVKIAVDEQNNNKLLLSISKGVVYGTVETDTMLVLKCNRCRTENYDDEGNSSFKTFRIVTRNREIDFQDLNHSIDIILELPDEPLKPGLYTLGKSISIAKIDFLSDEGGEIESTILEDGKIYFAELDEQEFNLKNGDFLEINGLENFQIERLYLNNQIKLSLYGEVRDLNSGALLFSRMPTYLEWLHANNSIALFVGTLIPVLSIILASFYRLKIFDDL
jgi:hypothetical protein